MPPSALLYRMSFAEQFLGPPGLEGFSHDMLKGFLDRGIEEGLTLDYKQIQAVENPDKIATSVTAFANSEGGLILLGVEEVKEKDEKGRTVRIRPGSITWGPKSLTREKLEAQLIARVHPWVQGLRIFPVRSEAEEVVFLVDVPQSPRPPHQAPDKKYYIRYNFQNLPIDHHQVAGLFLRRLRPDLRPLLEIMEIRKGGEEILLRIGLTNVGGTIAKWPMFFAEIQNCADIQKPDDSFFVHISSEMRGSKTKFTINSSSPVNVVHPRMINYLGTFEVALDGPLSASIMVGAEDMPTKHFLSAVSPGFLKKSFENAKETPIRLVAMSPEDEFDEGTYDRLLHQVGMSLDIFRELLRKIALTSTPEEVEEVLEEMDRIASSGPDGA